MHKDLQQKTHKKKLVLSLTTLTNQKNMFSYFLGFAILE